MPDCGRAPTPRPGEEALHPPGSVTFAKTESPAEWSVCELPVCGGTVTADQPHHDGGATTEPPWHALVSAVNSLTPRRHRPTAQTSSGASPLTPSRDLTALAVPTPTTPKGNGAPSDEQLFESELKARGIHLLWQR